MAGFVNVPGALASLVIQWWKHSTTKAWLSLLFRILFGGLITFLISAGSSMGYMLAQHFAPGTAFVGGIGIGMVWSAFGMLYIFKTDKSGITKNMNIPIAADLLEKDPTKTFDMVKNGEDKK